MIQTQTIDTKFPNEAEKKVKHPQEQEIEVNVPVETVRAYYALSVFARPVMPSLI